MHYSIIYYMATFISNIKSYTIFVTSDGVKNTITFTPNGRYKSGGRYTTFNENIIECLKNHPQYKKMFVLEDELDEYGHIKQPIATYPNVSKTQEVNRILKRDYKVDFMKLKSKEDTKKIIEELNLSFPDWNV